MQRAELIPVLLNDTAGSCQPFTFVMSQLAHLSARGVLDVVQHTMFSGTFHHCILVLGNCRGWIGRASP